MKEEGLDFNKMEGVVMAVVQDAESREVLMVGVMNEEALTKTRQTGQATFWSRTRKTLWTKGETSGNFLLVQEILVDCDQDTLLILAKPVGSVCHTGATSCFRKEDESLRIIGKKA